MEYLIDKGLNFEYQFKLHVRRLWIFKGKLKTILFKEQMILKGNYLKGGIIFEAEYLMRNHTKNLD